jgi:hypothetical protein
MNRGGQIMPERKAWAELSKDTRAIVIGAAALVLAAILLGLLTRMGSVDGPAFIALLLVPLLLFALVSGRLEELSGPGGWGAKFRVAMDAPVETSGIVTEAQNLKIVEKEGLGALRSIDNQLNPKQANALLLRVGSADYRAGAITQYIKTLKAVGTATYVIFVHKDSGNFIGSANGDQILAILDSSFASKAFMEELCSSNSEPFHNYDFLITDRLGATDTNKTALEKFRESGASGLVVVNNLKPVGVVDRNRLVTKLMINLAVSRS